MCVLDIAGLAGCCVGGGCMSWHILCVQVQGTSKWSLLVVGWAAQQPGCMAGCTWCLVGCINPAWQHHWCVEHTASQAVWWSVPWHITIVWVTDIVAPYLLRVCRLRLGAQGVHLVCTWGLWPMC